MLYHFSTKLGKNYRKLQKDYSAGLDQKLLKQSEKITKISIIIALFIVFLFDVRWLLTDLATRNFGYVAIFLIVAVGLLSFIYIVFLRRTSFNFIKFFRKKKLQVKMLNKDEVDVFEILKIARAKITQRKFLVFESEAKVKAMAVIRLTGRPKIPRAEIDDEYCPDRLEYITTFYKLRDFFSGLQKRGIPCFYIVSLNPISMGLTSISSGNSRLNRGEASEVNRLSTGERCGFFQTEVLFTTWIDDEKENLENSLTVLEGNLNSVLTSITAVFPEMEAVRLRDADLLEVIGSFFYPSTVLHR